MLPMSQIVFCENLEEGMVGNFDVDICDTNDAKWKITMFSAGMLAGIGIFLQRKWRLRCHRTLLTFHNLRAAVTVLLLTVNTLELTAALLPWKPEITGKYRDGSTVSSNPRGTERAASDQQAEVIIVIGMGTMWNALAAISFTISQIWYHRVVEVKKTIDFLYISSIVNIFICFLRLYELADIFYDIGVFELEPTLQLLSSLCLLSIGIIDGVSVYKERYKLDYVEDYDKIGYKHTVATFYSKACFWWLNPLLWLGYKEPLELEDLGQMRTEDSARAYYDRFLLFYKTNRPGNGDRPPSLWQCYMRSCWRMFALGGILKLFGDLFALIAPLAIQQIVQYIEAKYALQNSVPVHLCDDATSTAIRQDKRNSSIVRGEFTNLANSMTNGTSSRMVRNGDNGIRIPASGQISFSNFVNDAGNKTMANLGSFMHIDDTNPNDFVPGNYIRDSNGISNSSFGIGNDNYQIANGINYNLSATNVKIYYPSWTDLLSNGWVIAWIVLLAALAQGAFSQASTHILNMTGVRIKTSLQGLIYRKALLRSVGRARAQRPASAPKNDTFVYSCDVKGQQRQGADEKCDEVVDSDEDVADPGAVTNLMTDDTLNVMSFFWIAHYVWAIPLKIAAVMYLLYLKLGMSAVYGSVVCILTTTPLQFLIGKAMSRNTEKMACYTDERLKRLHETLMAIKIIKLNAWDDVFLKQIAASRQRELRYLNRDSFYWTLMTILMHVSSVLIAFVTLAIYTHMEGKDDDEKMDLTASRLFSALALFQQLTVPLLIFPITVPIIITAITSTKRLERFFKAQEVRKQFEGIRNMARILSKSDVSLDLYEVKSIPFTHSEEQPQQSSQQQYRTDTLQKSKEHIRKEIMISLVDQNGAGDLVVNCGATQTECQNNLNEKLSQESNAARGEDFKHPNCMHFTCVMQYVYDRDKRTTVQRKKLLRNNPYVAVRPQFNRFSMSMAQNHAEKVQLEKLTSLYYDTLLIDTPDELTMFAKKPVFTFHPKKTGKYLRDTVCPAQQLRIPKGGLTLIIGKNGSGKTTILMSMLMELFLLEGDMVWNKFSTFAYVAQQPWLINASIKENILFGESFRPKRYDFVLEVCALKPDIELMPAADYTIIGERGINLSGGQRQRIAIARALYSSANVVIMDDPLSSLDNEVANHIFQRGIKKMLLKAQRTVIMVTQQLHLIREANYLIVLDKESRLAGTYDELKERNPEVIQELNEAIERAAAEHEGASTYGRTARERWKLFRNVAKMGLQRSASTATSASDQVLLHNASNSDGARAASGIGGVTEAEIAATLAETDNILAETFPLSHAGSLGSFSLTRTRSSVYGSRHLIYDVPLPIDECQTDDVIMRRRRRGTGNSTQRRRRTTSARSSNRLSGNSNTSSLDMRRSLLTASYSSATSYASNNSSSVSNIIDVNELMQEQQQPQPQQQQQQQQKSILQSFAQPQTADRKRYQRHQRVQSWQPPSVAAEATGAITSTSKSTDKGHAIVARNVSSPANFGVAVTPQQTQTTSGATGREQQQVAAGKASDASLVADLVKSAKSGGGFQQFLRRMSMRRSNKPNTGPGAHRKHRPASATSSILSISEETTASVSTLPTMELSSITADVDVEEAETESWIANIENEESVQDASIGRKVLSNDGCGNGSYRTTKTKDIERKYGKIPLQIYLLYLRASSWPIVLLFFITALIWQCLRVYTDVWLRQWTDSYHNCMKGSAACPIIDDNGQAVPSSAGSSIDVPTMVAPRTLTTLHGPANQADQPESVTYYFRIYAIISCVCIVMAMITTPAGQLAGCNARRRLHDKLLHTIFRKSLYFFQVTPLGRIMNRFSHDMAIIDKKIAATSQRLLQFSLLCLCAILINVSITPWFMLLTVPICLAYYGIQKFYRCSSRELQRIENVTSSPLITHLNETIEGVVTIRAYNQEARFTEMFFKLLEENTIAFTILNTSNRWLGISLDYLGGVIVFVAIVTALLAATISCWKRESTSAPFSPSPSLVGLAINYTLLVPIYLNWVVKLLADMEMYVGSVERIAYYAEPTADGQAVYVGNDNGNDGTESKASRGDWRHTGTTNSTNVVGTDANGTTMLTSALPRGKATGYDSTLAAKVDDLNVEIASAPAVGEGTSVRSTTMDDNAKFGIEAGPDEASETPKSANNAVEVGTTLVMECNEVEKRVSLRCLPLESEYDSVPISWPQRGDICFENVSLRYEGQMEEVIKGLTLQIPAGQRIGICGRTGSGKSSLALSLFGVLQTTSGCIRIDDVDISKIHPDEVRTRLSIIPQDVHLFNASVRVNLDPPGYYSDLELWNCLEMAELKQFVSDALPCGLDTQIKDGGRALSAGQRQSICLARAILRGSVCLIMDEATSSLDRATEEAFMATAHRAFCGRTILTIAHRLSTILDYDRVIVLENGVIVEDGAPMDLKQKPDGAFRSLLHSGTILGPTIKPVRDSAVI